MTKQDDTGHDEVVHQMSHDVQHALHVISMAAEIIGSPIDDQKRASVCDSIKVECDSAAKTVRQWMRLSCQGCE